MSLVHSYLPSASYSFNSVTACVSKWRIPKVYRHYRERPCNSRTACIIEGEKLMVTTFKSRNDAACIYDIV